MKDQLTDNSRGNFALLVGLQTLLSSMALSLHFREDTSSCSDWTAERADWSGIGLSHGLDINSDGRIGVMLAIITYQIALVVGCELLWRDCPKAMCSVTRSVGLLYNISLGPARLVYFGGISRHGAVGFQPSIY